MNTVDTAYQMLVAEGYLEARERSGFFVLECAGAPPQAAEPAEAGGDRASLPRYSYPNTERKNLQVL